MKRIVALLLIVAFVQTGFVGCGQDDKSTTSSETLSGDDSTSDIPEDQNPDSDNDIENTDDIVVVYGWASGCAATNGRREMLENADIEYTFYDYNETDEWQSLEESAIRCDCHSEGSVRHNPIVVVNGTSMFYPTLERVEEYLN